MGFVVDRYWQIQNFILEAFWSIKVTVQRGTKEDPLLAEFLWDRVRLFDRLACLTIYEQCAINHTATVIQVGSKPKSKWRPLPLTTVELQKIVSKKLRTRFY